MQDYIIYNPIEDIVLSTFFDSKQQAKDFVTEHYPKDECEIIHKKSKEFTRLLEKKGINLDLTTFH